MSESAGQTLDESLPLTRRRLLLVEDNAASLFALSRELTRSGAEVEQAKNGLEAIITLADRRDIDAILMDMRMPVMDGFESIRLTRGSHLPILSLTADAASDDRRKCLAVGASAFMSKPVDIEALIRLLAASMTQKSG